MAKTNQLLFDTAPHGAQNVSLVDDHPDGIGNSLWAVRNDDGREMIFTGEELSSLAQQWLGFVNVE